MQAKKDAKEVSEVAEVGGAVDFCTMSGVRRVRRSVERWNEGRRREEVALGDGMNALVRKETVGTKAGAIAEGNEIERCDATGWR